MACSDSLALHIFCLDSTDKIFVLAYSGENFKTVDKMKSNTFHYLFSLPCYSTLVLPMINHCTLL